MYLLYPFMLCDVTKTPFHLFLVSFPCIISFLRPSGSWCWESRHWIFASPQPLTWLPPSSCLASETCSASETAARSVSWRNWSTTPAASFPTPQVMVQSNPNRLNHRHVCPKWHIPSTSIFPSEAKRDTSLPSSCQEKMSWKKGEFLKVHYCKLLRLWPCVSWQADAVFITHWVSHSLQYLRGKSTGLAAY